MQSCTAVVLPSVPPQCPPPPRALGGHVPPPCPPARYAPVRHCPPPPHPHPHTTTSCEAANAREYRLTGVQKHCALCTLERHELEFDHPAFNADAGHRQRGLRDVRGHDDLPASLSHVQVAHLNLEFYEYIIFTFTFHHNFPSGGSSNTRSCSASYRIAKRGRMCAPAS